MDRKFSFSEVVSDSPQVIQFCLEKEILKKPKRQKGGQTERNSLLRALLESNELTLKYLRAIDDKLTLILAEGNHSPPRSSRWSK